MPKEKIITAIDIGSSKICTIVASLSDGKLSVIGNSTIPSKGIDRGVVNDIDKAVESISESLEKAEKKSDRETSQGLIESYIHQNGKVGAMVEVLCETDFVARTDEFKKLSHDIAMQIAAMAPIDVDSLLKQEYIKDGSKTIHDLIKETIAKIGENITIKRFSRLELGK